MRKLFIHNLRLQASIGFYRHEKERRQTVHVNVEVELDDRRLPDDDVSHTLDYDFLRDGVVALVKSRHFNLQESLAQGILDLCFSRPEVLSARISTAKSEAYPDVDVVGVEMQLTRDEWTARG